MLENKSGNISETRKDRGKVTTDGTAYRNLPALFRMVLSPTPCGIPFPKIGVRNPHPKLQSTISGKRVLIKE